MGWRSSEWALWFGWTLVFGLLFTGVMLPYAYDTPDSAVGPVLAIFAVSFVLCPIAAYVIGVRFPSWWWAAGPPVAVFLAGTPLLLIPYAVVVPHTQGPPFQDLTYGEAMILAGLFMLLSLEGKCR